MNETLEFKRDSFDRYGDDLCELILSILKLDECFHYECVNKQWKRLIFNKQHKLDLDFYDYKDNQISANLRIGRELINSDLLEMILNRCLYIRHISIGNKDRNSRQININSEVIDVIRDKCQYLKVIHFNGYIDSVSHRMWRILGTTCGDKLEKISFNYYNYSEVKKDWMRTLFRLTPNLIEIEGINLIDCICPTDEQIWQKLRKLSVILQEINEKDLKLFSAQYSDIIEEINIKEIISDRENGVEYLYFQILKHLSLFKKLTVLHFKVKASINFDDIINIGFNLIAKNCKQLRDLKLSGFNDSTNLLLNSRHNFDSLKKLDIYRLKLFDGNFECLKRCPNLTYLHFKAKLYNDHYFNVHLCAPLLRVIVMDCNYIVTDRTLQSLAKLKHLYSLEMIISDKNVHISDTGFRSFIRNGNKIRKIKITDCRLRLTKTTIELFVERAISDPKHNYLMSCTVLTGVDFLNNYELNIITNYLPNNIDICVTIDEPNAGNSDVSDSSGQSDND